MLDIISPPLKPRRGNKLYFLTIARISGPLQDLRSLDDQVTKAKRFIARNYKGPVECRVIKSRGKGELLDRKEVIEADEAVASGRYDAVVTEDIGRQLRRMHAYLFCEACEDSGARCLSINDNIDTAQPDWRMNAIFAVMHHERSNQDTAERIRRTLDNRFDQGGVIQGVIFGYDKPKGCKHESQLRLTKKGKRFWTRVILKLERGDSYSQVVDWINRKNIPPEGSTRTSRWTVPMLIRRVRNPILYGDRYRGAMRSKRENKTGRRTSRKAPKTEIRYRHCLHLAVVPKARLQCLLSRLDERNANRRHTLVDQKDPLEGRPKKRTIWPGQHVYCAVCGHLCVYGANGQRHHLACTGALHRQCWNSVSFDARTAAANLLAAICNEIAQLPNFEPSLLTKVQKRLAAVKGNVPLKLKKIGRELERLKAEKENLLGAIRKRPDNGTLLEELDKLEKELYERAKESEELATIVGERHEMPPMDVIKAQALKFFKELPTAAAYSAEVTRILKTLIPRIWIRPYRHVTGGRVVQRARFTLSLSHFIPFAEQVPEVLELLTRELQVDLFNPPQAEKFRLAIREFQQRPEKPDQRAAARHFKITQTTVYHAVKNDRLIKERNIADPYVILAEMPADNPKLRRYRHKSYKFESVLNGQVTPFSKRD